MDDSDFFEIIDYEPYFSNSSLSLPSSPHCGEGNGEGNGEGGDKKDEDDGKDFIENIIKVEDEENDDFSCKSCDVFCKCPENVGLKKKCYYCLWSTTCARFEMICAICTCDLKFCLCKKPVRITKAEFTRLYYVTD